MTLAGKKALTAYGFLAVPLLFFVCVRFGPMLYMMAMSLTDWSVLRKALHFVRFANFRTIFRDPVFLQTLGNTARYAVFGAPIVIAISLGLALLLDRIRRGRAVFRFIYVLPYITPVVAVSWVWRWMFQTPPLGILNAALAKLGLPALE